MNRYPDKPATASDGEGFARQCIWLHQIFLGEDVGYFQDEREQLMVGESAAGVEFKHLQKSFDRLHIEVEERTSLTAKWTPSGIYAKSNTKRYCCGNEADIWVFDVADLRSRAERAAAHRFYQHPTIRSFVLQKTEALAFYQYRFVRGCGGYIFMQRTLEELFRLMLGSEQYIQSLRVDNGSDETQAA